MYQGTKIGDTYFNGDWPLNWIRMCERFFEVTKTPIDQWVNLATAHFSERANNWFNGLGYTWQQLNWQQLGMMIMDRFSEMGIHEAIAKFQSLQQTSSVPNYIDKFEECVALLKRDHPYLQESFFLSCFIGGLKNHIRHHVTCHQPRSLIEAYWYAKHIEQTTAFKRSFTSMKTNHGQGSKSQSGVSKGSDGGQNRDKDRNKCWFCQEPWSPQQNCKVRKRLLALAVEEGSEDMVKDRLLTLSLEKDREIGDKSEPEGSPELGFMSAPSSPVKTQVTEDVGQLMQISTYAVNGTTGPLTFSLLLNIGGV